MYEMVSPEELSAFITDIYDCAVDEGLWVPTLQRIARRLSAEYLVINLMPLHNVADAVIYSSPWNADAQRKLFARYVPHIPGIHALYSGPLDNPVATLSVVPEAEARQTIFYREWALPNGLRDGAVTKYAETAGAIGFLSFVTSLKRDPISIEEAAILRLLAPHVRRAMMIGDIVNRNRLEAESYLSVLTSLTVPILMVGARGNVRYVNGAADDLLRRGDVLVSRRGEIAPAEPAAAAAFADALARATSGDTSLGRRGVGLPLSDGAGKPAFVYILPVGNSDARRFTENAAAIFIASSDRHKPPPAAVLMTMFDLTPAEARLALLIGQGISVAAASEQLGVSANTLRTHLSHIFAKTGTKRQADLAALIASCALPLEMSPPVPPKF